MPNAAGVYSGDEIAALWVKSGGDAALAPTMAAIALAESGGDPNAKCYDYTNAAGKVVCSTTDRPDAFQVDTGLWQIANVNLGASATKADGVAVLSDPTRNAEHAVAVKASQGLGAWSSYTSGSYSAHLAKVTGTISAAVGGYSQASGYGSAPGAAGTPPTTAATPANGSPGTSGTPGLFGPIIDAANMIATEVFLGAVALALISGGILWLASTDSSVRGAVKAAAA